MQFALRQDVQGVPKIIIQTLNFKVEKNIKIFIFF